MAWPDDVANWFGKGGKRTVRQLAPIGLYIGSWQQIKKKKKALEVNMGGHVFKKLAPCIRKPQHTTNQMT